MFDLKCSCGHDDVFHKKNGVGCLFGNSGQAGTGCYCPKFEPVIPATHFFSKEKGAPKSRKTTDEIPDWISLAEVLKAIDDEIKLNKKLNVLKSYNFMLVKLKRKLGLEKGADNSQGELATHSRQGKGV